MKRVAALAFFVAASALAQRTITVSGDGRVPVTPDRSQSVLGVSTRAAAVADAMRENSERTRRVIDALKAKGVTAAEIQTTNFSVQQPWENGRRLVGQYEVQNNVMITRVGTAEMGDLLQAAVDAGANQVWNVHFFVADTSAVRDKALAAAYADAKTRAEKLAAAAGRALGEPVMITTEQAPSPPRVAGGVAAQAAPPIESGQQVVVATVIVTFELK